MNSEPSPTASDVSVVIVNYNGAAFIGKCLEGVGNQSVHPCEVIVVDNASSDGSVELIQRWYPEVRLVVNKVNRGFAGGCNDGVVIAQGTWIAFLNPDGRPEPLWLAGLLTAAQHAERGTLFRSLVLDDGAALQRYRFIETMNLCGRLVRMEGIEGDFAFASAGAAMLFEKAEYPVPFPAEYFLYQEDLFMSWRARLLGRSVILCRDSKIAHIGQASTKKERGLSHFHGEKNRLANFLTFWETRTRRRLLPLILVDLLLHLPQDPAAYIKAVGWIVRNRRLWRERRHEINSRRTIADNQVIPLLSARLSPRAGVLSGTYNRAVLAYCRTFGIGTLELRAQSA